VSGYFGEERSGSLVNYGPEGHRSLVDIVATWVLTDELALVLNYDWGRQSNALLSTAGSNVPAAQNQAVASTPGLDLATWNGVAGYVNYTWSEHWKSSVRAEYLDDAQGYRTGVPQTWRELTATIAYLPFKSIELRGEFRLDGSNVKAFESTGGNPAAAQQSVAFEALFKY
jgi:hypothetical protein